MLRYTSVLFFIFSCFIGGAQTREPILSIKNSLELKTDSIPWINESIVHGDAFSGNLFSAMDSTMEYGLGYKGIIPRRCQNKNLHLKISEQIRAKFVDQNFSLVVTLGYRDSTVFWNSMNLSNRLKHPGEWNLMEDEIDIPSSLTGSDVTIAAYVWNQGRSKSIDIDDLNIRFYEKEMPAFLPVGFTVNDASGNWRKLDQVKNQNVFFNDESGRIIILNLSGDTLIRSVAMYSEWKLKNKNEIKNFWSYSFEYSGDSVIINGVIIKFKTKNEISKNEMQIFVGDDASISFTIFSTFTQPVILYRHSVITSFTLPVVEVYKKSTLRDTAFFKNEYWLDKEGFSLSDGKSFFTLYRPSEISSVQLDVKNKLAVFNLDYSADHPLLYFPLLAKSQNKFEDRSAGVYSKGGKMQGSFTYFFTKVKPRIATMMHNPYGYQSSFIWTEHADYTDIRTHRAVYFGSEKIHRPDSSSGGFLKYSIPVTKSVFYSNPDKTDNSVKAGFMPGPIATIKETEGFRNFLRQLDESGIEICLHTPDQFTTDRKILEEALEQTRRDFNPSTWIDHGYDNSPLSNREDLVCDGTDSTSKWYSADLWKKYGLKYFWNCFYEDTPAFSSYSYNSFFSIPYSGWDDAFPTPLYWTHKSRTGDIIHWKTTNTMDPADGNLWSYLFSDVRISDMVMNRNNITVHCYPARVDSSTGFYDITDGVVTANEEFNKALGKLSSFRAKEKIWLTTIREMLDYRTSLEKISYEIFPDGSVRLHNTGKAVLRGVTFSVNANSVYALEKKLTRKKEGTELLFWLDLLPDEKVRLVFQ